MNLYGIYDIITKYWDLALIYWVKRLAGALSADFRVTDCAARLGRDEFALIMMNVSWGIKPRICDIIDGINEKMTDISEAFPRPL